MHLHVGDECATRLWKLWHWHYSMALDIVVLDIREAVTTTRCIHSFLTQHRDVQLYTR